MVYTYKSVIYRTVALERVDVVPHLDLKMPPSTGVIEYCHHSGWVSNELVAELNSMHVDKIGLLSLKCRCRYPQYVKAQTGE